MKDPSILLEHILDSIKQIEEYANDLNSNSFLKNVAMQDAIQKRLLVIGEAVKNVPDELKKKNTNIPWRDIASMRDFIVHEYFDVSLDQVWTVVVEDIPALKDVILKMLKEIS